MHWLICIQNVLVDLYAKCGEAHEAWIIFKGLSAQDMCYEMFGINQDGYMAVQCLKCMLKSCLKHDATTFTCNIHCSGVF